MDARIEIAGGNVALIDVEDYEAVAHIKWHMTSNGYARGYIHQTSDRPGHGVRMHRFILGMQTGDAREVDHINGDRLDNRRANLRICTRLENSRNTKLSPRNTSGYKGVYWSKRHQRWHVQIWVNTKTKHIGLFNTPEEGYAAYCEAAKKYFGEFARI